MKIATFNINNINRRLPNLLAWMRTAKPDVVALQELKASDGEFPAAAIEKAGYGAVWRGQKNREGGALLAPHPRPPRTPPPPPGRPHEPQGRHNQAPGRGGLLPHPHLPQGKPP